MRFKSSLKLAKFLEPCDSCANQFDKKLFQFHIVNTEKPVNSTNSTYDATTMEPVPIIATTSQDFIIVDSINNTGRCNLTIKYLTILLEI